ncbi:hypothetical protein SLS53_000535 [Cytospora paraplurivora]|uniref:C2H2-type domain-containing protein n=1 Tax=Cytospora paraplurivora TaxID=2898453 RepID=A0AAN9UM75_9PEZI
MCDGAQDDIERSGQNAVFPSCRTHGALDHHRRQFHAVKQDISCPGCGHHCIKLSDFIKHIEFDECPTLKLETLEARMHHKILWIKGLGELDGMSKEHVYNRHEKSFYPHLGHDPKPLRPWWEGENKSSPWQPQEGWYEEESIGQKDESVPKMTCQDHLHRNNTTPNPLSRDENNSLEGGLEKSLWAETKTLVPNTRVARIPTPQKVLGIKDNQSSAAERIQGMNMDPADPNSSRFDAEKFWVAYLGKYKCPRQPCKKSFTKQAALIQHLRSAAHNGTKASCPACLRHFESLYALAAHVESQSQKCYMRQSKVYNIFLHQLTLGMAEVGGSHGDFMQKYQLQKEFLEDFGPQKTTYGHQQVYGSGSLDAYAPRDDQPRLTAGALAKQQQEIVSAGKQTTLQWQQQQQREHHQQNIDDDDDDGPMPLTAEALSRLNLQEQHWGGGGWGQASVDTQDRPSGEVLRQSSGPHVVQQQQQTGGGWDQPVRAQEKQQTRGHGLLGKNIEGQGGLAKPVGGYDTQTGRDYMW